MNDRDRLEQLRGMLDRLGRMPASADRDWLLGEVRRRTVDVETGAPSSPMRVQQPDDEVDFELAAADQPTIKATRTRRRRDERHAERPAPPSAVQSAPLPVPAAPIARQRGLDLLELGGVLSLAEPSTGAADGYRPWTRGLRG